jgi:pimeloyl-ACP methyl ester carboxylesterase
MPVRTTISQERFEIAYQTHGESGPWVVCINAIMETMSAWRSVVEHLTAQGARVLVFDFPVTNRSDILHGPLEVTVDEKIAIVRDVVAVAIGPVPVRILASSWGSLIGAKFAVRHPEMVERLLLGSFGLTVNASLRSIQERVADAVRGGDGGQVADIIAETFGRGSPQPLLESMKRSLAQRAPREWQVFLAHVAEFRSFGSVADHVDFANLEAKTLWLNGIEDEIINLKEVLAVLSIMKNVEAAFVPGAGHFLHHQIPAIIELIGAFLLDKPYTDGVPGVSFVHARRLGP